MANYWQSRDQNPDLCSFFHSALPESLSGTVFFKEEGVESPTFYFENMHWE